MKKNTLQLILSFLILAKLNAQIPNFSWADQLGGSSAELGSSVTTDALGNVYSTGDFRGTGDFDPGSGTFNMTSLGLKDIFISKLDASGNFVWAKQIGNSGNDLANSISVDAFNNVYITGSFNATADFDPGTGTFNMTSFGGNDIFITKLDATGNFLWSKQLGGTGDDFGNSIYVNSTGVVYSAGVFGNVADFDPGAGTFTITASGSNDAYVSKLDPSGNFIFAKSFGGIGSQAEALSIAVDPGGNIVCAGTFSGIVDMNPGAAVLNFTSTAASYDAFVCKLDGTGNFTWAKQLGGNGLDQAQSVTIGSFNDCYVTGFFSNTADFDPGAGTYTLASAGSSDVFISKLDVSGNFSWAKRMGDTGDDFGFSIAYGSNGIYTTGSFNNIVDFDPGVATYTIASKGSYDGFVSKLDAAGNFLFAKGVGGIGNDYGVDISTDPSNNIYLTGQFDWPVDFDPTANTFTLSPFGNYDAFVTKWSQCIQPNAPTITTSAAYLVVCVSGTVIINASSTGTITWYTSPSGTTSAGIGNNFTTPVLTVNTTYYAEAMTCASSVTRTPVTITVAPQPTINITVTNSVVCLGFSTKLTAGGAATYTWSGGVLNGFNFYPTVTTTYSVIAKSSLGCTNTAVSTITVNTGPSMTVTSTSTLLCEGETATLTASGSTNTYFWTTGDTTPSAVVSPTVTTSYTVSSAAANGCMSNLPFTQSVSACIGIKEISKNSNDILVYPNPSNENFNITSVENMESTIFNELGQVIKTFSLNEENNHFYCVNGLSDGIYYVYGKTQNAVVLTKIVVISR